MMIWWPVIVVSLLKVITTVTSEIINPCVGTEDPIVEMAYNGGQTVVVNFGECNITFQCCESEDRFKGARYLHAVTPNGSNVAADSVADAEYLCCADTNCFGIVVYPVLSNNGLRLRCQLGPGSSPYIFDVLYLILNETSTTTTSSDQNESTCTCTTNDTITTAVAKVDTVGHGYVYIWLPIVVLVVAVVVMVAALLFGIRRRNAMLEQRNHEHRQDPENDANAGEDDNNDDNNNLGEFIDLDKSQQPILPNGKTTSGFEVHEETETQNGPIAGRSSVDDLRKRHAGLHRSPLVDLPYVHVSYPSKFNGESPVTFEVTMEGNNDLTEMTNSRVVAIQPRSSVLSLEPVRGEYAPHVFLAEIEV